MSPLPADLFRQKQPNSLSFPCVVSKAGMQAALKMNSEGEGQNGLGYEVNVLTCESSQHANYCPL